MILIHIAGHLGADPETRYTPNGQKVTALRVATTIRKKDKEKTIWWRVTIWGDRFDKKLAYLKKGSPVYVVGDMGMPEIYVDKSGNHQTSFEVTAEYLGFSPYGNKGERSEDSDMSSDEPARSHQRQAFAQVGQVLPGAHVGNDHDDDDIPF